MQIKKNLEFDVLKEHFHLPMVEVAEKFGICTTVFKRMCRNHGIKRWPFRKVSPGGWRALSVLVAAAEHREEDVLVE